jgi:hypothetical protein
MRGEGDFVTDSGDMVLHHYYQEFQCSTRFLLLLGVDSSRSFVPVLRSGSQLVLSAFTLCVLQPHGARFARSCRRQGYRNPSR